MGMQEKPDTLTTRLKFRWYLILRGLLSLWVKPRIQKDSDGNIGGGDKPVCYVLQNRSLSARLVLEQICLKSALLAFSSHKVNFYSFLISYIFYSCQLRKKHHFCCSSNKDLALLIMSDLYFSCSNPSQPM